MVTEGQVILSDWGKGGADDAFESYTQAHDTITYTGTPHTPSKTPTKSQRHTQTNTQRKRK